MYVTTCVSGFNEAVGTCDGVVAWVQIPEQSAPLLPPLTLAEGTAISFAIVGVWTLGLGLRLYIKASRS
jgi:hypothetical protein